MTDENIVENLKGRLRNYRFDHARRYLNQELDGKTDHMVTVLAELFGNVGPIPIDSYMGQLVDFVVNELLKRLDSL